MYSMPPVCACDCHTTDMRLTGPSGCLQHLNSRPRAGWRAGWQSDPAGNAFTHSHLSSSLSSFVVFVIVTGPFLPMAAGHNPSGPQRNMKFPSVGSWWGGGSAECRPRSLCHGSPTDGLGLGDAEDRFRFGLVEFKWVGWGGWSG